MASCNARRSPRRRWFRAHTALGAPPVWERAMGRLRLASATPALATIPAAVAFTGFAPNVFVLTCAAQASAVPALVLGLLNHPLSSYAITCEWHGRGFRKSEDAHAGCYHGSENNGSHNSSLEVDEPSDGLNQRGRCHRLHRSMNAGVMKGFRRQSNNPDENPFRNDLLMSWRALVDIVPSSRNC
jgi:hypothetical protein